LGDAIDCYSNAIEAEPTNTILFFKRGIAWSNSYYNRGKEIAHLRAAISDYSHAIELKPQYGAAFFNGLGFGQSGEWRKAMADYRVPHPVLWTQV
jgi:tetratricopeptide (TPR) repeat protein